MSETFGYVSGILMMLSVIPYIRSILKGNTKPHRVAFFIWTILILIAFFSQLAKGATWSLLLTAGDSIAVLITFILSIKYGVGGFRKIDIISLVGAGISLLLWYFTKEPAAALYLIILIDLIGLNLIVIKTWKNPETENWVAWAMCGAGGLFGILAVGSFNIILLSYPIYICIANAIIAFIVITRKKYLHLANKT
ncbi:hypothetical protein HXX01_01040 [Candidatus Nomurabacteria bacterium]|nr:hypothetical protein [Candidatus Nomurabacteria bacterium]